MWNLIKVAVSGIMIGAEKQKREKYAQNWLHFG